jgi:hypothetical protein
MSLELFEASFPVQNERLGKTRNNWIDPLIKISCKHKRNLHILNKRSNDPYMRAHYNKYCKTLSRIMKEAKRLHC